MYRFSGNGLERGENNMDEELSLKQVPQSLEAEQAVLGSILIDSRCVSEIIGILRPEDFYLQQNREIYETIYTMFNFSQTIDPVTVLDKMRQLGCHRDDSRDYIMQLMQITPTAANAVRYANIVREKSMLRGLADASEDISQMVYTQVGTPSEILESAEKKIYALRKGERTDSLEHIGLTLHKVFDRLTELSQSDSAIPGMSTGLMDLDKKINGLNKSDLLLIAARPAMGKSAFALNIGLNVAKKNDKTVALFSLEMSREQLAMRLLASESFVELQKLATGKLTEEEWTKLCMASAALSQTDIRIDDNPSITVAEMNAKLRRIDNLGLVIIDYLQLMQGSGYGKNDGNRVNIVSDISRSLKIMAKELNVPVVCLSQLSRGPESRTDKRPMLSDLRESGAIEQDADEVLFLYRDEYYNENTEEKGVAECIVAKNRHGEVGTVKLQWVGQYQTFTDREWKHAE
jgi:replicative DNA helicase